MHKLAGPKICDELAGNTLIKIKKCAILQPQDDWLRLRQNPCNQQRLGTCAPADTCNSEPCSSDNNFDEVGMARAFFALAMNSHHGLALLDHAVGLRLREAFRNDGIRAHE